MTQLREVETAAIIPSTHSFPNAHETQRPDQLAEGYFDIIGLPPKLFIIPAAMISEVDSQTLLISIPKMRNA